MKTMVKVVILTAGFSLMACNAPVTIVSPTNGEVSTDPVYFFTLRFGKSFVSQPGDGLYIWTGTPEPTGTPYAWGLFAPSPAAGVTKSGIQPDGGCPECVRIKSKLCSAAQTNRAAVYFQQRAIVATR